MSYLEFHGLRSEPFSNAPVDRFYFGSSAHEQALTRLSWAVEHRKGLAMLTGDIGTGKTTLARRLLDRLPEDEYEATLLVLIHGEVTGGWLLHRIALQLGVDAPSPEKLTLLGQLYQRLLQIDESGRRAVVLIDEAQMLRTREVMEELRGLLNLELPERKLLTFVLFGLPEIESAVQLDPPLQQRVALRVRLTPLAQEATQAYVKHRLKLAGARRMPFSLEAVRAVHLRTRGIPRLINTLCDNLLLEGYLAGNALIAGRLVGQVADELGLGEGGPDCGVLQAPAEPPADETDAPVDADLAKA